MWHANDGMGWWMLFGGAIWLLFWVSIIYLFFTAMMHRDHRHDDGGNPMDIARRRLASGDITPEQFEEIARHLRPPAAQSP
jgi:uncharacterized membrane protein